jgi:hypothetical protein
MVADTAEITHYREVKKLQHTAVAPNLQHAPEIPFLPPVSPGLQAISVDVRTLGWILGCKKGFLFSVA